MLASLASAVILVPIVHRGARGTALGRRILYTIAWMAVAGGVGLALNPLFLQSSGLGR